MPIKHSEEIEYCKLKVDYVADSDVVKAKVAEAVSKFRVLPVPGFRPGKASDFAVMTHHKKHVFPAAAQELVAHAYDDVLFETGITPLGFPNISEVNIGPTNFSCTMLFTKKPEFELQQYTGFEIPKPHIPQTTVELAEAMLQQLREQYADVEAYGENDFVQIGDKITMDIEFEYDDKKEKKEGEFYSVGSNALSKDFDDSLLGMVPDEEREFSILSRDGKKISVKVKLHMGMKSKPCSDNEELAKRANQESYSKLREAVSGSAMHQNKQREDIMVADQIKKRLISGHDFEVPKWLTLMEGQSIAMQEGFKWDDLNDEAKESYIKRAEDRVKLSFIFDSIRKKEPEAQMSDEEVREYLVRLIAMRGGDPQQVLVEAEKSGRLFGMVASVRDEATIQWLVQSSKIVE